MRFFRIEPLVPRLNTAIAAAIPLIGLLVGGHIPGELGQNAGLGVFPQAISRLKRTPVAEVSTRRVS